MSGITRRNIKSHVLFMQSMDERGKFWYHTGFRWAPCDQSQNDYVFNHLTERVFAAPFFDPDTAKGLDVFGVFVMPGMKKR